MRLRLRSANRWGNGCGVAPDKDAKTDEISPSAFLAVIVVAVRRSTYKTSLGFGSLEDTRESILKANGQKQGLR